MRYLPRRVSPKTLSFQQGFTLVEIISVLILLSIVALYVGPRFISSQAYIDNIAWQELRHSASYARNKAMVSNCHVAIVMDLDGFELQIDDCNDANGFNGTVLPDPSDTSLNYESVQEPASNWSWSDNPIVFSPEGALVNSALFNLSGDPSLTLSGQTLNLDQGSGLEK
jgi:prepilin-type N-terminal cleavage/methylation domain-containing protein